MDGDTIFPGDILIIPDCGEEQDEQTSTEESPGLARGAAGWLADSHTVASARNARLIAQR